MTSIGNLINGALTAVDELVGAPAAGSR
jgi:hypothetical protein